MKLYSDRTGYLYHVQSDYDCYVPRPLDEIAINFDLELINLLAEANCYIGKLSEISRLLPDKNIFISKFVEKEAAVSSQIEGTQASLEDVFQINKLDLKKRKDTEEIVNYVHALNFGIRLLDKLPISIRYLKEVHKVLLQNTRGSEKNAGEIRNSQNWIGPRGSTLNNAAYIPPSLDKMKDALFDLEKYINSEKEINPLIQVALIHYQFETIHPFLDGNGRLGRMLIPIFLKEKEVLNDPILYLSLYFKINRSEYYESLMNVRFKGKVEERIKYFLKGVIETSKSSIEAIENISVLNKKIEEKINKNESKNKDVYFRTLKYLYQHPYFDSGDLIDYLKLSKPTILNIIKNLEKLEIVSPTSNKKRYVTYRFNDYVSILEKGTEI